jgi:nitroreductase
MKASELEEALQWRYATKQFDSNSKISTENWKVLEEAFLLCPSSYGLQPWKFIVVENKEIRKALRAASWDQSQVTDASHYVVLLIKEKMDEAHIARYVDRVAEVRGMDRADLKAYEEMMVGDLLKGARADKIESWAKNQTYIAMGFLLQAAAVLKIDSCPMEGLDPNVYDEILKMKGSGWATVASIAFGFRDTGDRYQRVKKVRFSIDQVIEHLK